MSRYRGNHEKCPHCGTTYGKFRVGLTFAEVKQMLWVTSDNPSEWRYSRRNTVLGYWHELKKTWWELHQSNCNQDVPF